MAAVHAWEADRYSEEEEERTNQPPRHKLRVWGMDSDSGSDEDEPARTWDTGRRLTLMTRDPDPLTDTDAAAEMFLDTFVSTTSSLSTKRQSGHK